MGFWSYKIAGSDFSYRASPLPFGQKTLGCCRHCHITEPQKDFKKPSCFLLSLGSACKQHQLFPLSLPFLSGKTAMFPASCECHSHSWKCRSSGWVWFRKHSQRNSHKLWVLSWGTTRWKGENKCARVWICPIPPAALPGSADAWSSEWFLILSAAQAEILAHHSQSSSRLAAKALTFSWALFDAFFPVLTDSRISGSSQNFGATSFWWPSSGQAVLTPKRTNFS